MKLYEKMGIDPNTVDGVTKLLRMGSNLVCDPFCNEVGCLDECSDDNFHCAAVHLFDEVPTKKVKRWETYNGEFIKVFEGEVFEKALFDYKDACPHACEECKYSDGKGLVSCFIRWLMEEIEVEE